MNDAIRLIDEAITKLRRSGCARDSVEISALESTRGLLMRRVFGRDEPQHIDESMIPPYVRLARGLRPLTEPS